SIDTHIKEHPGVLREDRGVMFCNYCDLSVEWKVKSTVDGHCNSKGHIKNKQIYENKEKSKKQVTLASTMASESKKEMIEDLIKAFSFANIPLEKVNSLLPFFKKHLKEGGAIPQASTLRQVYLPNVFDTH
ncbi:20738_t:CDS:1, partial [Gigaspora rosea]